MFKQIPALFRKYFAAPSIANLTGVVAITIITSVFAIFLMPKQANTLVILLPGILALFVAWRAYLLSSLVMFICYVLFLPFIESDLEFAQNIAIWIIAIGLLSFEMIYRLARRQRFSEAYYRALVQNANDLTCILDKNGLLRYMSPSFYRVLGYTEAELLGTSAFALMHPEDRPIVQRRFNESINNANEIGRDVEFRLRHHNGAMRWFTGSGVKKPNEPMIRGMIINARDITERKQAELELAAEHRFVASIIDATSQPLCVSDVLGNRYYYVNAAYCELVGYSQNEIMLEGNFKLANLISPEDYEKVLNYRQQAVAGVHVKPYLSHMINRLGQQKDVWVNYGLVHDNNGEHKLIVTLTDITIAKQTETALKLARDKAEEASKLKSQFLATISHELRTPMNAILGYTELLLDSPLDENQRDFARTAYEAGESLLDIINEILDFARIEAGKFVLDYYEFDLEDICNRTVEMLRPRANSKKLALELHIASDVPPKLWGDGKRLRQILVNLINNAIKFTPHGSIKLSVRMTEPHRISADSSNHILTFNKHELYFEVEDTGVGISDSIKTRLFQPFSQGDSSHTRPHGGTGLGLSICKGLVEMMGGNIGLYSQEGHGSIFWFTAQFSLPNQIKNSDSGIALQYHHHQVEEIKNGPIARINVAYEMP